MRVTVTDDELASPSARPTSPDPGTTVPQPAAAPPRDSWPVRVAAFAEVVACSDAPTQLLLIQMLAWLGLRPLLSDGRLSMAYVATLSLVDTAALIFLMLWFLRRHREAPGQIFLGTRPVAQEARLGVLLAPAIVLLVVVAFALIQQFAPWLHNVTDNPLESLVQTPRDAVTFGIVAIVAGGIREEMQRAFILRRFERHLGGRTVGLVVFSAAFGAGHLLQGWDAAVITAGLGLVWGVVYLTRGSIVAPMVSHACFNAIEILRHLAQ